MPSFNRQLIYQRTAFSHKVDVYSDLPNGSVEGELAYVKNESGSRWLLRYKPRGIYKWNGLNWVADRENVVEELENLVSHSISENNPHNTTPEQIGLGWSYYKDNWSEEPFELSVILEGRVFQYNLEGVDRYRFVPDNYKPEKDAFYANFDGSELTNLIATRG